MQERIPGYSLVRNGYNVDIVRKDSRGATNREKGKRKGKRVFIIAKVSFNLLI